MYVFCMNRCKPIAKNEIISKIIFVTVRSFTQKERQNENYGMACAPLSHWLWMWRIGSPRLWYILGNHSRSSDVPGCIGVFSTTCTSGYLLHYHIPWDAKVASWLRRIRRIVMPPFPKWRFFIVCHQHTPQIRPIDTRIPIHCHTMRVL